MRNAKAPSAGSTMRRLGRIFRGALATRGASGGSANGSSEPSGRRLRLLFGAVVVTIAAGLTAGPAAFATTCPNEAVRSQQGSTYLPDCRAYEQITPTHKAGYSAGASNLGEAPFGLGASADGSHLLYWGLYPIPPSNTGGSAAYFSTLGESGWLNASAMAPAGSAQVANGFPQLETKLRGSTPDQQTAVYWDNSSAPYGGLWLSRTDGELKNIANSSEEVFGSQGGEKEHQPWFEAISADGRHVVFADTDALLPGISSSGNDILYEWIDDGSDGGAGTLRVVNRTNAPSPTLIDSADANLGGSPREEGNMLWIGRGARNAISADGSRIFFQNPSPTADSNGRPQGGGALFLREDGQRTVEVSAPAPDYVSTNPPTLFQYLDASTDGRFAFFWANGDLSAGAPAEGGVYRYDVVAGEPIFVASAAPTEGLPPTALASADGTHLYYQDGNDVRVWSNGSARLVASNQVVRGGAPASNTSLATGPNTIGFSDFTCPTANVSDNGNFFAFSATPPGGGALNVFRFDDLQGSTILLSPHGLSAGDSGFANAGECWSSEVSSGRKTRLMSDDGQYVFFSSAAPLVPGDTNQRFDAYEWHQGSLSLISSGRSEANSFTAGTDAEGRNAFFGTAEALVPNDGDNVQDLYTARVDGGRLTTTSSGCEGDACQGSEAAPPRRVLTGSSTLGGAGNVHWRRRCHRGKRHVGHRRRGRCVARHRHHPHKKGSRSR